MSKIGRYNMKLKYDDMGEIDAPKIETNGDGDDSVRSDWLDLSVDSRLYQPTK